MLIQYHGYDGSFWADSESGKIVPEVVVDATGKAEKVFQDGNEEDEKELMEAFRETDLSDEFEEKYGFATRNAAGLSNSGALNLILEKLAKLEGRENKITLSRFLDAIRTGIDSGTFARLPKAAPVTPRSRNDQGQFQNALWLEYQRMLDDKNISAADITRRLNSDRAFREAVEEGKRNESGVSATPAPSPLTEENERYLEFSLAYRRTPSLKPVSGYVTLDYGDGVHKKFPYQDFQVMTNRAIELGVL